ncbi:hypothetical protein FH063_003269 [Azospirillum argentinense]|uniref:Uncharacterized protein n=1 Tax=Azospirillum argentinense TaxID=2970906 RepID=A0A5B0KJR4_9PROT|nr:hypothetical protein FH063_003269 [Azospirillum argentinense]
MALEAAGVVFPEAMVQSAGHGEHPEHAVMSRIAKRPRRMPFTDSHRVTLGSVPCRPPPIRLLC